MPQTEVVFYCDSNQMSDVKDLLAELKRYNQRAFAKCFARIDLLRERGNDLRRPHADILRDGIWELRISDGHVNYRILYFFYAGAIDRKDHLESVVVLAHLLTKEDKVPAKDIDLARKRKKIFEANPREHIYGRLKNENDK